MRKTFIHKEELMHGFFSMSKEAFLRHYTEVSEFDYIQTVTDVLDIVDYCNKENVTQPGNIEYVEGNKLMTEVIMPKLFMKLYSKEINEIAVKMQSLFDELAKATAPEMREGRPQCESCSFVKENGTCTVSEDWEPCPLIGANEGCAKEINSFKM